MRFTTKQNLGYYIIKARIWINIGSRSLVSRAAMGCFITLKPANLSGGVV